MNFFNLFRKKEIKKTPEPTEDYKKQMELLEKLGASSSDIDYKIKAVNGDSIVKDGRIDLTGYEVKSSTAVGYIRKPNYRTKTGFTGCDSLVLVNGELNESIETLIIDGDKLSIGVPIMSCCDNDYKSLSNLFNGTITQLLINEYDQYVVRDIKIIEKISEFCNHSINSITLSNVYKYNIDEVTSFKTLSDAEFIARFDKIIKKTGNGEYMARK
jgi:hypothetical protein